VDESALASLKLLVVVLGLWVTVIRNSFTDASKWVEELFNPAYLELASARARAEVIEKAWITWRGSAHANLLCRVPEEALSTLLGKTFTFTQVEVVDLVDWAVTSGRESAGADSRVPILTRCARVRVGVDALAALVVPNLLWKEENAAVEAEAWVVADALAGDVVVELPGGTLFSLTVTWLEQAGASVRVPEETWWAFLWSADALADSGIPNLSQLANLWEAFAGKLFLVPILVLWADTWLNLARAGDLVPVLVQLARSINNAGALATVRIPN
jgi:hypothetical protein